MFPLLLLGGLVVLVALGGRKRTKIDVDLIERIPITGPAQGVYLGVPWLVRFNTLISEWESQITENNQWVQIATSEDPETALQLAELHIDDWVGAQ